MSSEFLWTFENVSLSSAGKTRLRTINLQIPTGITAIMGPSGAGKTSLLNLLVGFERPTSGRVLLHNPSSESTAPPVFWVPQDQGLWTDFSVLQQLSLVCPKGENSKIVRGWLEKFGLTDRSSARIEALSMGERERLAVARALATGANVLVCDEPMANIDPESKERLWRLLVETCQEQNTSLVFSTHVPDVVLTHADHLICIDAGQVMTEGSAHEIYDKPSDRKLAHLLGPTNWFESSEQELWLGKDVSQDSSPISIRPERIEMRANQSSPIIFEKSQNVGSLEHHTLRHAERDVTRTIVGKPTTTPLKPGERIAIRVLLLLLCCFMIGCNEGNSESEPALVASQLNYWALPAEGSLVPSPRGLHATDEGEIYVLDTGGRVVVFNQQGEVLRKWFMPEYEVGKPEGIYLLKDGRIAIADTHYHQIVFFDQQGKVLDTWGELGTKPGQFVYPVALTQDDDENIYVCEYENDRVQKFDVTGEFLLEFGSIGEKQGEFQRPSGIVWHDEKLFVADAFNNRLQIFDENGQFLHTLPRGTNTTDDDASEESSKSQTFLFNYPYDVAKNTKGELFVIEYGAGRVTVLQQDGKLVGRFGSTGDGDDQFSTPWGLTVDSRGHIFVADTGNRRIVEIQP